MIAMAPLIKCKNYKCNKKFYNKYKIYDSLKYI